MVAYSFQPRFIEPIRQGLKTQTIRAQGLRRHARPGELLQLYSGMRTPHCQRILPDTPCLEVMNVQLFFAFAFNGQAVLDKVVADGVRIRDLDAFSIRDGFTDREDMSAFWRDHHPRAAAAGFTGVLIEWARPAETMLGVAA